MFHVKQEKTFLYHNFKLKLNLNDNYSQLDNKNHSHFELILARDPRSVFLSDFPVVIVSRETMQLNANKNHSHLAAIRGYRSVIRDPWP
jgi:hypothetical protein